jgi:hypothetical protein
MAPESLEQTIAAIAAGTLKNSVQHVTLDHTQT